MRTIFQNEDSGAGGDEEKVPERSAIEDASKWDVAALYADVEAWEGDFEKIDALLEPVEAMRGTLNSPEALAALLEADTRLDRLLEKLHVYAHLRSDENTGDNEHQALLARIGQKGTEAAGRLSWITPEILSQDMETLRQWRDSEILAPDRYVITCLLRRKPHTLSDGEESLLSRAAEIFSAPHHSFSMLTNADMSFPNITDGEGRERELSQGRYITFLLDNDREVRRQAFEAMYDTYGSFRNTLASTVSANVKLHNYMAQSRHFPSALEAALHPDQVPAEVYNTLISATHEALPTFFKYVALRKKRLGLKDLGMHDLHVPIIPEYKIEVPFEQAREWILEACRPLGESYVEVLRSAFESRWVDVFENRGKRSGAYSSGCYDSLPYILMNYQGTLDSVFTLAHELGHSMHTYLANQSQPPRLAHYPIFIAEIPSTLNEGLLQRYLLETQDDPRFRAYLLNHYCDSVKGTVYRQTMFAEFEKKIHEMDGEGQPLTPDVLTEAYYLMNTEYYGPDMDFDKRIGLEWSRIPHFYYNFYVYKYATSFCASQIFLQRVTGSEANRDQYLDLLRAGGSGDPLDLIDAAGVSLRSVKTLESAFEDFGKMVTELGETLEALAPLGA